MDNLETYFEFRIIPCFDVFDQLDTIVCKIFPRDEYLDRIDYAADFEIHIDYKAEGITASVEYDRSSGTFTYGSPPPGWGGAVFVDEVLSVTNENLARLAACKTTDPADPDLQAIGTLWTDSVYHENGLNGCNEWSYVIEQVQGTLVLFAE